MRVLSHRDFFANLDIEPVAIGFSPVDALSELARHLDWPFRFLSDPDRTVYHRLGLGRAGSTAVFNAGTRAIYRDAIRRGAEVRLPVEDFRQLGGDAVAVNGTVVMLWRPVSPDDRPEISNIVQNVQSLFA